MTSAEKSRRYKERHPDRVKAAQARYREKNLAKLRKLKLEYQKKYYAENREKILEYNKTYHQTNRERILAKNKATYNPVRSRGYTLKKYGLTHEQFDALLASVGNKCSVCGRKFVQKNLPHIDHCHTTGVVRGILCSNCNTAEGLLKTPEAALKLYDYMRSNELFYQGKS